MLPSQADPWMVAGRGWVLEPNKEANVGASAHVRPRPGELGSLRV